jgi:uncharacterized phage-associated protein
MFNAVTVANYFVQLAASEGKTISLMKLVKLVYIAHGWSLGLTGQPLIKENVQAWKYGPVIQSVYDAFKLNKDIKNISQPSYVKVWGLPHNGKYERQELEELSHSERALLLDEIWDGYKGKDAIYLSSLTHQPSTPWYEIWNNNGGHSKLNAVIPQELIKNYYERLAIEFREFSKSTSHGGG